MTWFHKLLTEMDWVTETEATIDNFFEELIAMGYKDRFDFLYELEMKDENQRPKDLIQIHLEAKAFKKQRRKERRL